MKLILPNRLLKNTLKNKKSEYKIVLVSPTTHHYWNLASVRGGLPSAHKQYKQLNTETKQQSYLGRYQIVKYETCRRKSFRNQEQHVKYMDTKCLHPNQLFAPIQDHLAPYKDTISFVHGTATSLDPSVKTVTISTPSGTTTNQQYDILVITTGSRTKDLVPWKPSLDGYEATKDGLHKIQEQVKSAKSIVLGGAGPTGVEAAAEFGYEYGKGKEITLVRIPRSNLRD